MAWTDKPSVQQLNTIRGWMKPCLQESLINSALVWLENNADRKQVSEEMSRLRFLHYKRKLDRDTCFRSDIWEGFEYDPKQHPSVVQTLKILGLLRDHVPAEKVGKATLWIESNSTRREAESEIKRLEGLKEKGELNGEICFASKVWEDFIRKEEGL